MPSLRNGLGIARGFEERRGVVSEAKAVRPQSCGTQKIEAMITTAIFIRNMVCDRCIFVVRKELTALEVEILEIDLGRVIFRYDPLRVKKAAILERIQRYGFEFAGDKEERIVAQIKRAMLELIRETEQGNLHAVKSEFIAQQVGRNYGYLTRLFSAKEGISIEKYIIRLKIERAKEMLWADDCSLSEVAFRLGYSSVQHLSLQFKQTTGLTITEFRRQPVSLRKPLDNVGWFDDTKKQEDLNMII